MSQDWLRVAPAHSLSLSGGRTNKPLNALQPAKPKHVHRATQIDCGWPSWAGNRDVKNVNLSDWHPGVLTASSSVWPRRLRVRLRSGGAGSFMEVSLLDWPPRIMTAGSTSNCEPGIACGGLSAARSAIREAMARQQQSRCMAEQGSLCRHTTTLLLGESVAVTCTCAE